MHPELSFSRVRGSDGDLCITGGMLLEGERRRVSRLCLRNHSAINVEISQFESIAFKKNAKPATGCGSGSGCRNTVFQKFLHFQPLSLCMGTGTELQYCMQHMMQLRHSVLQPQIYFCTFISSISFTSLSCKLADQTTVVWQYLPRQYSDIHSITLILWPGYNVMVQITKRMRTITSALLPPA